MTRRVSTWIVGIFTILATFIVHGQLLFKKELLVRDDRWLTAPLKNITSLADWWAAIRSAELPDFQPVRDFSYWLDWRLADAFQTAPLFHLSNTAIWLICLMLLWKITLSALESEEPLPANQLWIPGCVVLLAAVHPVFVEPVAWISGRKHLLSLLFTLAATLTMVRGNVRIEDPKNLIRRWLVPVFYGLAVFSQPINVLWPLWAMAYIAVITAPINNANPSEKINTRDSGAQNRMHKWIGPMMTCVLIGIIATAINTSVYQGREIFGFLLTPHALVYGQKLSGLRIDELDLSLLAAGRYAANILLPIKIAHRYHPGSWINLVGVIALPLLLWIFWRMKQISRQGFLWLFYAALPLAVVTVQLSDIFVADSYALAAMPGFMIAIGLLLRQTTASPKQTIARSALISTIFVLSILGMASMRIANSWRSAEELWARAQSVEETPDSLYFTSGYLLNQGYHDKSLDGALRLFEMAPGSGKSIRLLAYTVCEHPNLPREKKLQLLSQSGNMKIPPVMDCLAEIHANAGEHTEALSVLLDIAENYPTYFLNEMKDARDRLENACRRLPEFKSQCEPILSSIQGTDIKE